MTREEAIVWLNTDDYESAGYGKAIEMAIKALKQEPKTGHWQLVSYGYGDSAYICECSECKDTIWVYKDADRKWKYCPSCGAKMVVPQESEE